MNSERTSLVMPGRSKGRKIGYWITTAIVVYELLYGATWDFNILNKGFVAGVIQHLGYPAYFPHILGACKIPAAIIILLPGLSILKEWAYAGAVIIFGSAIVSHSMVGDPFISLVFPFIFGCLTFTSWALRPAARRTAAVRESR